MKEYKLTGDMKEKLDEMIAFENLRDRYVELRYFGFSQASNAAKRYQKARREFWNMVYKLYPELLDFGKIKVDKTSEYVYVVEKDND